VTKFVAFFAEELNSEFPPILRPAALAKMLGLSVKTIYGWISAGRFDGCMRKRGKHCLILRDRAIEKLFNDETWSNE
jgi:predicted site-specific integrase-resolvase